MVKVFGSSLPSSTKNVFKVGPPLTKLSGSAHAFHETCCSNLERGHVYLKKQKNSIGNKYPPSNFCHGLLFRPYRDLILKNIIKSDSGNNF